jgi:hypothetical protein
MFLERGAYEFHMIFMITGPLFLNLAVIIFTIIFFIDKRLPTISMYSFLSLSVIAILFSILVGVASTIGGTFEAQFQRLGNTLFQYFLLFIFILQGVVFFIMVRKIREKEREKLDS